MTDIKFNYLPVRYSYETRAMAQSVLAIAYAYSSEASTTFQPRNVGFDAPATQSILNNLPQWMYMRQKKDSNGWKLVNSWGQNFELLVETVQSLVANKYLVTADVSERSTVHSIQISDPELLKIKEFKNLLFNSSFCIRGPVRTGMPSGWSRYSKQNKNNVFSIPDRPFLCPYTMVIKGAGVFGQMVNLDNRSVKDLTASIYCFSNSEVTDIKLILICEMEDAKSKFVQSYETFGLNNWRRIECTLPANGRVFRAYMIVHSNTATPVYFNAPKLEVSSRATPWCKSTEDVLPYVPGSSNFSQVCSVWG